jgi:hypothetical protein
MRNPLVHAATVVGFELSLINVEAKASLPAIFTS